MQFYLVQKLMLVLFLSVCFLFCFFPTRSYFIFNIKEKRLSVVTA